MLFNQRDTEQWERLAMAHSPRRKWTASKILMRVRRMVRNDQLILALVAFFVGGGVGVLTIGFRLSIQLIQTVGFGDGSEFLPSFAADLPWWHVVAVTTVGGLAVGLFIYFVMPGRRPQGVADTIEAGEFVGGRISFRAGVGAAIASILSIGTGGSVGREGPAVHLGASFGSWISDRFRLTGPLTKAILGCGVAAAVASSFNAPIAGALFAHEVVVGHYALSAFAPVVIASVTSTVVSRAVLGDFPAFQVPPMELASLWEFPAFVGLGVVCGITAIALVRGVGLAHGMAQKIPGPQWLRPMVAGLMLGVIAIKFPQILGVGYEATNSALTAQYALSLLITLLALKIVATALCLGFGYAGGIFSPALVVGAMLGGAYGHIMSDIAPALSSGTGAYTIVGMGGVAAAALGAPISTIFIIFEMTSNYGLTIAVMTSAVVASVVFRQTGETSFFSWQLKQRGVDLKSGYRQSVLKGIFVRQIMGVQGETVPASMSLPQIRGALQQSHTGVLFVVDQQDNFMGTITLLDLANVAFVTEMDQLILASDVVRHSAPVVTPRDDLETVLALMQKEELSDIAVVRSEESPLLLGRLRRDAVMSAFTEALVVAHNEER